MSRSGYYRWLNTIEKRKLRELQDYADFQLILNAYNYRSFKKGARSIYMRLKNDHDTVMNLKKIRRLMKKYHLECPIRKPNPRRQTMKEMRTNAVADNLLKREFREHGPRRVLLTDITYIPYKGIFCYLSVIKDAYTKEILAHVLSESLAVDFVLETIHQLISIHGISLSAETMIHSDQGSHYTSVSFRELLKNVNLRQSMSRRGNCWDNAPQESLFGHMKEELADRMKTWKEFSEVRSDIDDWVDYYNNDRYQWGLNQLTPTEFYKQVTENKVL